MSDDQAFEAVWYVSLLLMVLAAAVPLARAAGAKGSVRPPGGC